jgi:uncharacterized protein (TIGR00661 family)
MIKKPARILVAPMDWGLGHASRCVPIIETLLSHGAEVVIGSNGRALSFLQEVFPGLEALSFPAYNIRYPGSNMLWNMATQSHKFWSAIYREHKLLESIIQSHSLTGVVSDNRFGCWSTRVPCVFVSHQTYPPFPRLVRQLGYFINHYFIRKYNQLWIPDIEGRNNLSGELSRSISSLPTEYLGSLSQLAAKVKDSSVEYELLVLLSGPEPQRSLFEKKVMEQVQELELKTMLVQGKTEFFMESKPSDQLKVVSFLKQEDLGRAISSARYVLCRSGYSSLMDLSAMGKKAILIPTPGQAEQEYLAKRMQDSGYCPFQYQHQLDIKKGLESILEYEGLPMHYQRPDLLSRAVKYLLDH